MTWGLALSGGGARGAYTAGVQRYLFTELPKKLGFTPYPDYVSGVSVGAINGYFSATHSDEEIRRMTEIWHNLKSKTCTIFLQGQYLLYETFYKHRR